MPGFSLKIGGKGGWSVKYGVGWLTGFVLLLWLFAAAQQQVAFAQSGSTGGVIGKQDKSVSGGEEPQTPPPARPASKPSTATPAKHSEESGGCGKIAGTWTWSNNLDVVVKSNRTADATNGGHAALTCDGGMYVFNWSSGNATRMTLAADGKRLSGMGSFGPESAVRK